MTTQEFLNEFNILYDNIASKGAPGLDAYEISVLLTYAQEELVKNKNTPKSNKLQEGFEQSEKRRYEFKELLRHYNTNTELLNLENLKLSSDSKFFEIPKDVLLIKYESAVVKDPICDLCDADVKPKNLDEFNTQKKNPFKKPNKNTIWRIDYNSSEPGKNIVELISSLPVVQYNIRYIKQPSPIILTNLNTEEFANDNVTILGQTNEQTSELHPNFHSEIVRRAVELATLSYKENNLNNLVNLYQRKE